MLLPRPGVCSSRKWLRAMSPSARSLERLGCSTGQPRYSSESSRCYKNTAYGQAGKLGIVLGNGNSGQQIYEVSVRPTWSDEFRLSVEHEQGGGTLLHENVDISEETCANGRTSMRVNIDNIGNSASKCVKISVAIPEHSNISIDSAVPTNFSMSGKLEGNLAVSVPEGDITVNKARGEAIQLKTQNGTVNVPTWLEGDQEICATKVKGKRLMGKHISVEAFGGEGIDIDAMYGGSYRLKAPRGQVSLGHVQGSLSVQSRDCVTITSADGSVNVKCSDGNVTCHVDKVENNSTSEISSENGRVTLTAGSTVVADLRLEGERGVEVPDFLHEKAEHSTETLIFVPSAMQESPRASTPGATGGSAFESGKIRTSTEFNWGPEDLGNLNSKIVARAKNGAVSFEFTSWIEQTLKAIKSSQKHG